MTLLLPRSPAAGRALTWRGSSQGPVSSRVFGPLAAVRHLFRDHSTGDSDDFGDNWREPRTANGHRYHPHHHRKGADLASDWRTLYLASKLAHWSGLTYLPADSPLAAALEAQGLQLVAAGRTAFTSWFVADGVVDVSALSCRAFPQGAHPAQGHPQQQHPNQEQLKNQNEGHLPEGSQASQPPGGGAPEVVMVGVRGVQKQTGVSGVAVGAGSRQAGGEVDGRDLGGRTVKDWGMASITGGRGPLDAGNGEAEGGMWGREEHVDGGGDGGGGATTGHGKEAQTGMQGVGGYGHANGHRHHHQQQQQQYDQNPGHPHEGTPVRLHLSPQHHHQPPPPPLHLHHRNRAPGTERGSTHLGGEHGAGGDGSLGGGEGGGEGGAHHPHRQHMAHKASPSDKARHVPDKGGERAAGGGAAHAPASPDEEDAGCSAVRLPAGVTSPLVPGTRCRFIFLRGVHWAAPETNTLSLSASLATFWPTPLVPPTPPASTQEPPSTTPHPAPGSSPPAPRPWSSAPGEHLVAHSGVAALARELMPAVLPHIRDAAASGAQHLIFAGHSLGGSLGKLLWAMSLLGGHSSPASSSCHTFGSLPVLAHASGGGGGRVLRALGAPPAAALNWVLEHDPIPRALLTADPTLVAARAALPGLDALLALRGAVLGEGAPLSSGRFLYESVGELMLVRWCAKGGCEVLPVSEADTEAVMRLDTQQAVTAPVRTLQHWLDHHHASYHHDLEAAALATYRRQARAQKPHR